MPNQTKVVQIRRDVLQASHDAGACHLGSSLSCVEILVALFYERMQDGDRFIFSKASGAATYYAILADKGYFTKEDLVKYLHDNPECSKEIPGILHSVGSVGHGLSVAVGLALSDRTRKVYCLISDGEVDEGTTYEAALFARHHKLDNLYVICDNNGLQANGATKDILDLTTAFEFLQKTLPHFENVITKKGQGVSFMSGRYEWHYRNLSADRLAQALQENV